ncbi:MAG: ABC transporter ATP-binding protein [Parachlamydiaceae bacterium]
MEPTLSRNILHVLIKSRLAITKGLFLIILSNVLLIANPLVLRQAVQALDESNQEKVFFLFTYLLQSRVGEIWPWALILLSLALLSAFFKYRMRFAFLSVSREEEKLIRSKLFSRIQKQSLAFFNAHGVGELMSRLTNDITAYRDMLGPGLLYPAYFLTLIIPGFAALFYLSPVLATISLIPVIVIPLLNLLVRKRIYNTSVEVQETLGQLSNLTQEDYSGIKIIRCYNASNSLYQRFIAKAQHLSLATFRLDIWEGLFYPFLTLVTRLVTVLLVMGFGWVTFYQWRILSAGDFVAFMWIQSYIFGPILMLGWALPIYQQGRAAYDRLKALYEEPLTVSEIESRLKISKTSSIIFNHLSFSYPGSRRLALNDIQLAIEAGTFVGLTGPTGSGKTTLVKILERTYEIPRGMLFIGDHDIHDFPFDAFREAVISVEQLPFLFSKTIAENVRFGKQEATQEEVENVAHLADLHETILGFPEGYQTIVGERGVTLSGGQKQRVAMARSFLVNRSILLLDDIFSNVDVKTEQRILQSLIHHFRGKTVLLVSHRASVLAKMDRVLYMKEGKVVEDGKPKELLNKTGYFSALMQLQSHQR